MAPMCKSERQRFGDEDGGSLFHSLTLFSRGFHLRELRVVNPNQKSFVTPVTQFETHNKLWGLVRDRGSRSRDTRTTRPRSRTADPEASARYLPEGYTLILWLSLTSIRGSHL
ncbi:unnamed protein product [Leuciscus chuanchicus]